MELASDLGGLLAGGDSDVVSIPVPLLKKAVNACEELHQVSEYDCLFHTGGGGPGSWAAD